MKLKIYSLEFSGIAVLTILFLILFPLKTVPSTDEIRELDSQNEATSTIEIRKYVSELSVEEKIGQMMMVSVSGTDVNTYSTQMIRENFVGGVVLLGPNISSSTQTQAFLGNLQKEADQNSLQIPLFTAVDQEGGLVTRVKFDYIQNKSAQKDIALSEAESVALIRAGELRDLGFNTVFAPVSDYSTDTNAFIYSRTFQTSELETISLSKLFIAGYISGNVIPTAKHFPGHGNSLKDPHKKEVIVSEADFNTQVNIFDHIINDNDNSKMMVMTGHIAVENVSELPATLSPTVINYLRNDIGYTGAIITDDIKMLKSISNESIGELAVKSVMAGNDIVLLIDTPEHQLEVYNVLLRAVKEGRILMDQVDASLERILVLKYNFMECTFLNEQ